MTQLNQFNQPIGRALAEWNQPECPQKVSQAGIHCRLEPLSLDHARSLHQENKRDKDGINWTYLAYGPFEEIGCYERWVSEMVSKNDPQFYSIFPKSVNRPLGVISLMRMSPKDGTIEVGHIHYSNNLKGTTAATEAIFLLANKVFELGFRRLEWKCDSLNAPSQRAAKRFGFTHEGTFRNSTVYKNRSRDTAWFSITDSEWPHRKKEFKRWLSLENFNDDGSQKSRLNHW